MRSSALARRYAKALLDIAEEEGSLEVTGRGLRDLLAVFEGSPELTKALSNPMHKLEERKALAGEVAGKLSASDMLQRFLAIIVGSDKVGIFDQICDAYFSMEDTLMGRVRATIISPAELAGDILDDVKAKLKAETGKDVILAKELDPSLIGGFVIKVENTMLDGSLKTQLHRMKEKILEGVV